MPNPTKIVVHFDDGTTYDIPADSTGSIFLTENKAKKCGHNPPYGKPPQKDNGSTSSTMLFAAADTTTGGDVTAMEGEAEDSGTCYMINGVIVCP
jgi:hypothetical protein